MQVVRGCLVVPVQVELYDDVVLQIQRDILEKVQETHTKGVIIDVSAVEVMDSFIAQTLSDTARMASLLGAKTVLCGLQAGVVAALVDLNIEFHDVQTARTLEDSFRILEPVVLPEEKLEEVVEDEDGRVDEEKEIEEEGSRRFGH